MLQFIKYVFATFIGIFLFLGVILIILVGVVASKSKSTITSVEPNSILKISFNKDIVDQSENYFDPYSFKKGKTLGLRDILYDLHHAQTDAKIKGIFLDFGSFPGGYATTEEIRNALIEFKKSKKRIYAYGDSFSEKTYYLNSIADKLYLNPEGLLEFNGLSSEYTFYKGALDKLGIDVQVFRVGKYKSFVEPFTLDKMSAANRTQVSSYLNSIYQGYMRGIAKTRNLNLDSLLYFSNNLVITQSEDAVKHHLIDGTRYRDEVLEEIKNFTEVKKLEDIPFVSLSEYDEMLKRPEAISGAKVSVLFASGDIVSGDGNKRSIGSDRLSASLREARLDKEVKAIVLRVNSPGGSALASDIIWREVLLTKKVKPIIVSMGDVAASGGYYISAAASKIFAEPNTITGSIGIFGLIPNAQKFLNDKLGLTFDQVKTGKYADIITITRPLKEDEKAIIQNQVNHGYQSFLERVAKGRNKTKVEIDSIAQGRVWTGEQAMKIGLVDQLGGLNDAIKEAAKEAKLDEYSEVYESSDKKLFENFLSGEMDKIKSEFLDNELGKNREYLNLLKSIPTWSGIQARCLLNLNEKVN
jgi:protease IV